ncbi:MAG: hypothetical protein ACWA41_07465 [Putridiphycobacter sp.]
MSIADYFQTGERQQDLGHFRNLVLIANVDGNLDDHEILLLYKIGQHIGLSNTQIGEVMDNPEKFAVIPPLSRVERMEMTIDMVRMMVADGKIEAKEESLLRRYVVQIGYKSIDDVDVESMVALIERGEDNDTIISELG